MFAESRKLSKMISQNAAFGFQKGNQNASKIQSKIALFFRPILEAFWDPFESPKYSPGLLLASLWHPLGLPWPPVGPHRALVGRPMVSLGLHLASLGLPLPVHWPLLGSLCPPLASRSPPSGQNGPKMIRKENPKPWRID